MRRSDGLGGWCGGGGEVAEERLGGGGAVGGCGVGGGVGVVVGVERAVHGAAAGLEAGLAGHLDGDPAEHHRRDGDHRRHHRPHPPRRLLSDLIDGLVERIWSGVRGCVASVRREPGSQLKRDKGAVAVGPACQ